MLKRRLIPILYMQSAWMVRSELFKIHQAIGNPFTHVERMVQWDVDELVVIDIGTGEETFDFARDDYRHKGVKNLLEFIHKTATECRIPLTFGGRIRTFGDIQQRIQNGADKIAVNSALADSPGLVSEAARSFGRQAIIASVDYRMTESGAVAFTHHGSQDTKMSVTDWVRRAADLGAGEILLNAIDRDGTGQGYDLETIRDVVAAVDIPVIACGGAGHQSHFLKCFAETEVSGVAAGNIFHFTENAYPRAKVYLRTKRDDIR